MTPPDTKGLEEFIDGWGLETAAARLAKRAGSTIEEIRAFHAAMVPRLAEFMEFLDTFPIDRIPHEHRKLSFAVLAVLETDDAVHIWRRPALKRASDIRDWYTKTSFYDKSS